MKRIETADTLESRRAEAQRWRDDALETAARICEQYGEDGYGAALDIRALKSDYPFRSRVRK